MYETAAGDAGCVLGFSCLARKAQASRFGTKTQLAGRTLTPMPPPDGRLTAELRHRSENAHRRSRLLRGVGRVVPTCAVLQADRARAGLRYANAASALRGGVKKIRIKTSTG